MASDETEETESSTNEINCPSCGERAASDLWEYSPGEEDFEIECGSCGVTLDMRRHVSIDYTARVAGSESAR